MSIAIGIGAAPRSSVVEAEGRGVQRIARALVQQVRKQGIATMLPVVLSFTDLV